MGNLLEYSGIVTKTRAMEAKLLTPAQFEEIASLHNVPEVVEYLKKETAYADILEELAPEQLHRGSIEKILTRSLYRDYAKLYRFCGQKQRKLMKLRLKSYEIELINYCLRIVINHYQKPFDLDYKRPFFDRYSQISIEKLITSRTTDELIETLKETEYYEPLKKLKDSPSVTLYDYDLALNLYYFTTLWKARKKVLKKEDKELYQRDCGTQIDLVRNAEFFLDTALADWDCRGTGTCSECIQGCRHDRLKELDRTRLSDEFYSAAVDDDRKSIECHIQNDELGCQGNDGFGSVCLDNRHDRTEDTDRGEVHNGADDF